MKGIFAALVCVMLVGCGDAESEKQQLEAEIIRLTKENVDTKRLVATQARMLVHKQSQIDSLKDAVEVLASTCAVTDDDPNSIEMPDEIPEDTGGASAEMKQSTTHI